MKIPEDQIGLALNGRTLSNWEVVYHLGKKPLKLHCLIKNTGTGGALLSRGRFSLDPRLDEDLSEVKDDGQRYFSAGITYHRPFQYKKYALTWPCLNGKPVDASIMAVGFVAVPPDDLAGFIERGTELEYMTSDEYLSFPVIATPDANSAEEMAKTFPFDHSMYVTLVEALVNPAVINEIETNESAAKHLWGVSSAKDIWPTAIWVKQIGSDKTTLPQLGP